MRSKRTKSPGSRRKTSGASDKTKAQPKARRSSVGGAANAAGETFRTDVAARIAVHVCIQSPLLDLEQTQIPRQLQPESASEVDDIEVVMESGGTAWIQAKRSLKLSAAPRSSLAAAFDQLVRQHLRNPSLDPSRDRLVIAYESGPRSIATLRVVIRRFRSGSPTREQAAPDQKDIAVLEILERIVENAWKVVSGGSLPTWPDLSRFLRLVVLWEVKEGGDGRVEVDPGRLLGAILEDETDAAAAADVLRRFVSTLATNRGVADAIGLRHALQECGIRLRHLAGFAQRLEDHLCRLEQRWVDHRPLGVLSDNTAWRSPLRSSEVFVPPRLQHQGPRVEVEHPAEAILDRLRQRRSIALLGHVGTGKSTLLLWCAAELAARRRAAPTAPVPIWLHARELQENSWPEILEHILPGAQRSGAAMTWCLLVDGVDEVGLAVWSTLADLRRRFSQLVGIVATSRPTASPAPEDGFETLQLPTWSAVDVERFLTSWSCRDSDAVTRLRAQLGEAAGTDLLSTPLTATAALLISNEDGVFIRSRADLFSQIARLLFRSWRQSRARTEVTWDEVQPVLLDLAQQTVRGEPLHIEHVRRVLAARGNGAAQEVHDEVERHLGVLVRVGRQHFEFVHRSIAEHLIGDAMRASPSAEFEQLARAPWSREVIRHAIGISAARGDVALAEARLRELADLATEAVFDGSALHAVLSAAAAVADLAFAGVVLDPDTTAVMVDAIMTLLTEEFSSWVGDTIVEHVRRLAQAGGALWEAVLTRITDVMRRAQLDPEQWYCHAELSIEDLIVSLLHRDPEVRAIAVERLAPHIERPEVQQALFRIMFDEGHTTFAAPPAMRAGLAWRTLARGPHTADAIQHLRRWLTSPGTSPAGAAALALRPDEAPPRELALALRWLSQSCDVPQAVIDELMSTPEGACALREVWPDWATRVTFGVNVHRAPPDESLVEPPPSHEVRLRMARACGPQLAAMDPETLAIIGTRTMLVVTPELIASGCIERALDLRFDDILPDAQQELGAQLLRSPEVRQRVLQAWPLPAGRLYPGIALESLIEAGDDEAAAIYREYLLGSPYCWGPLQRPAPARVLTHPLVLPRAREFARNTIERTRTPDREGIRLSVIPAAVVLSNLAPAWSQDPAIMDMVWSLLESDQPERLIAVLNATHRIELDAARMNDLFARVRADLETLSSSIGTLDSRRSHHAEAEIEWLEERGLVQACSPMLRTFTRLDDPVRWRAFAVLWPELSEAERRAASDVVAEEAIADAAASLPRIYLERFVRAAPESWCNRLVTTITSGGSIEGTVGVQTITLLPRNLQLHIARALRDSQQSALELPWRVYDFGRGRARPADTIRRLLFELGE